MEGGRACRSVRYFTLFYLFYKLRASRYDPVGAAKRFWRQPIRWLRRNVEIFVPLFKFIILVLSDIVSNKEEENRNRRASELLDIISAQVLLCLKYLDLCYHTKTLNTSILVIEPCINQSRSSACFSPRPFTEGLPGRIAEAPRPLPRISHIASHTTTRA